MTGSGSFLPTADLSVPLRVGCRRTDECHGVFVGGIYWKGGRVQKSQRGHIHPQETNMKAEHHHHPFEKDIHLPNLHFGVPCELLGSVWILWLLDGQTGASMTPTSIILEFVACRDPSKREDFWFSSIWANYNDLSRGHLKWWFRNGIPQKIPLIQV